MNRIRTMIVDDEALARQRVRELLSADADVELVGECAFGEDAVVAIERERPDLVFLDVCLPDIDGFAVIERVDREVQPLLIFLTAYDEYAVKAFNVRAIDYLVKPFERDRLYTAVGRAKRELQHRAAALGSSGSLTAAPAKAPGGRIALRTDGRVLRVRLDEIERVEAERDTSRFHMRGGAVIEVRESLTSVEQRLPSSAFLRVHRSHIVNVARVREVQPWFQGDSVLILEDGSKVVTGTTYREKIRLLSH
jgi:two-component system LytT family response regulator